MSRAEFANRSENSPTFQYEVAVKPEVSSMADTLPRDDVSRTQGSSRLEGLPKVEASQSEISFGSDESSTFQETSMSEAFPGPEEPSDLEFALPDVEAKVKYFLAEDLSQEAMEPLLEGEPFLQEAESQLMPPELLSGLHDPFAEVEAKLARLSSTVARTDVPQADVPKVPMQVADVMQDAMQKFSRQSWAGGTEVIAHVQTANLCPSGTACTVSVVALAWLPAGGH